MQLHSTLPFPHLTFKHWGLDDRERAVVIVKGTFGVRNDGTLGFLKEQEQLIEEDEYWGDEPSSLKIEQEIAPAKDATDVIVNAIARSPNGEPCEDWAVSVEIVDRAVYSFHVRGPSLWQKDENERWQRGEVEPVTEVPLRYEYAYGGQFALSEDEDAEILVFDGNPVGLGFAPEERLQRDDPISAPQIGELAEFMNEALGEDMTLHGAGAMDKSWLPRRSFAGIFDEEWEQKRHPRMPKDYQFRFWNAAHPRLQFSPALEGGETIRLTGMQHETAPYLIQLPKTKVMAHKDGPIGSSDTLELDTIRINVESLNPLDHRVILIWRIMIPEPDAIETLYLDTIEIEEEVAHV